jgi:TonB family protein
MTFRIEQSERAPGPERHSTSYYDKNGDLILELDYAGGRMTTRKTFRHNGPDEVIETIEDGGVESPSQLTRPNPPAPKIIKHRLKFDSNGNVVEESLYLEDGTRLETTEYKRDPRGRVLESQVKSLSGTPPVKHTFAYGEGNEPVSYTYERLHGQPETVRYSYQYDSMNNWIKRQAGGSGPLFERAITYYSPDSGEGIRIAGESPADPLQPAPFSALPKVIRKSGGVLQSEAIRRFEPAYPMNARAAHITGSVLVEIRIDHSGDVVDAKALSGPPELQDAAVQAAKQWRFRPTMLSGVPVDVIGAITFNFLM